VNKILAKRNVEVIKDGKKLLVGYLVAGYPGKEAFLEIISKCEVAGVDIFEIGFPSADPSSDGEVIRNAHQMVDPSICRDEHYWEMVRRNISKPIWLMGYKKDLIDTGFYRVLAEKGLIDALVIPDMNCEEHINLGNETGKYGVDVVGFVNPEMTDSELEICFESTALVYQQLYAGPTGMSVETDDYKDILYKGRMYKHVKVFAGFGISTPERVNQLISSGFDGVIMGTAMIKKLNDSEDELMDFIKELNSAAKKAGGSNEVYCYI
jgi:tryptophan synthase alpha chain